MEYEGWKLILTCEHGGNTIPGKWQRLLKSSDKSLLQTHRGWDIGALKIANALKKSFDCPLYYSQISRLLIDLNRSPKRCFGSILQDISNPIKDEIYQKYYLPYRSNVTSWIEQIQAAKHRVLHLSVHSFTPQLNSQIRNADLSLLYDPSRKNEVGIANSLIAKMKQEVPEFKYRRNYPYLGIADGLTSALRKKFSAKCYAGIEIEINQKHLTSVSGIRMVSSLLIQSLSER